MVMLQESGRIFDGDTVIFGEEALGLSPDLLFSGLLGHLSNCYIFEETPQATTPPITKEIAGINFHDK